MGYRINLLLCIYVFEKIRISKKERENYFAMRSNEKLFIFLSLLSLAGLPPFLGFFRKIIILLFLIGNSLYMLSLFLVVSSISLIFLYSRVFLNSLIIQVLFNKVSHCSNNYIGRLKIIFVLFLLALIVFFTV